MKKLGLIRLWVITVVALWAAWPTAHAADRPYNESADAHADVRQALAEAKKAQLPVLLVFGANWCEDCRVLDTALKSGKTAELVAREFRLVKVDVGNFNRNLDIAGDYGNPIKQGIPAAVVLSPDQHVLYATRAGELADARRMREGGIHDFMLKLATQAKASLQGSP